MLNDACYRQYCIVLDIFIQCQYFSHYMTVKFLSEFLNYQLDTIR